MTLSIDDDANEKRNEWKAEKAKIEKNRKEKVRKRGREREEYGVVVIGNVYTAPNVVVSHR